MTPVVCVCQHVPEEVVEQACQRGARCLDDVRDMTGACTGCGDCAPDIEDILADHLERDHLKRHWLDPLCSPSG